MHSLRLLAIAGLIFGISSAAGAAPVAVTYGFGLPSPSPGAFTLQGNTPGASSGPILGGQLTVLYSSGSSVASGTVGPKVSLASLQLAASGVTLLGVSVPGWSISNLPLGILGTSTFSGNWLLSQPPNPLLAASGLVQVFNAAPGLVLFNGFGQFTLPTLGGLGPFRWDINASGTTGGIIIPGNVFGQEIARTVIPEPTTGLMVLMGLSGMALYGGRRRMQR